MAFFYLAGRLMAAKLPGTHVAARRQAGVWFLGSHLSLQGKHSNMRLPLGVVALSSLFFGLDHSGKQTGCFLCAIPLNVDPRLINQLVYECGGEGPCKSDEQGFIHPGST